MLSICFMLPLFLFFFPFIIIRLRLITSQHCSGFCHTLAWISHGVTYIPHPDPPSHLPLHLIPLGLPSAPGPSNCLMHPTWAGDLFLFPVSLPAIIVWWFSVRIFSPSYFSIFCLWFSFMFCGYYEICVNFSNIKQSFFAYRIFSSFVHTGFTLFFFLFYVIVSNYLFLHLVFTANWSRYGYFYCFFSFSLLCYN